jgi:hypothetical protein
LAENNQQLIAHLLGAILAAIEAADIPNAEDLRASGILLQTT